MEILKKDMKAPWIKVNPSSSFIYRSELEEQNGDYSLVKIIRPSSSLEFDACYVGHGSIEELTLFSESLGINPVFLDFEPDFEALGNLILKPFFIEDFWKEDFWKDEHIQEV